MKSFEKFLSKALKGDELKQIKGGTFDQPPHCFEYSSYCAQVFRNCTAAYCDADGSGIWSDCVYAQTGSPSPCSPLQGHNNLCYHNDCDY